VHQLFADFKKAYDSATREAPGVKLTTHLHLVPRSRMLGAMPPLPQYAFMAWRSIKAQGQIYLYLCCNLGLDDELNLFKQENSFKIFCLNLVYLRS
jgi:hypothetical protein